MVAEALDGTTAVEERRAILGRLRSGATTVVANCAVLTEGFDEPAVSCVVIARPTRSAPLYRQMSGRGTRLYPGKEDLLVLDLVGAVTRHDLATATSLFGVEPDGSTTLAEAALARQRADVVEQAADVDGKLVARTIDLFGRRRLHWVAAGEVFVLPLGEHGAVHLRQTGAEHWRVEHRPRRGGREVLARDLPLGYAQGLGEDVARRLGADRLTRKDAPWRHQPATPRQRELLRRRGVPTPAGLTKGEASDLITRLAVGWSR